MSKARITLTLGALAAVVVAVAAALVELSASPGPTEAAFPGANGKIAFASHRDAHYEIYSMEPDGSNQTRLTNIDGFPSGDFNYGPVWSPDGSKIAFTSYRNGNTDVYVMNADGGGELRLTDHPEPDGAPSWSPDSTKIVFVSRRVGTQYDLYVMDADGSNETRLTVSPASEVAPAWSPDSTKIAYADNYDIYVMGADGVGSPVNLTQTPNHFEQDPDWSPDGQRIAFTRNSTPREVYVMNADGSGQTNLTNSLNDDDEAPAWSPDGAQIAFDSNRDGNYEVYIMNADGSDQMRLVGSAAADSNPGWQPVCGPEGCPTPVPTSTATPCAPEGCPTATPTPTPTPTATPCPAEVCPELSLTGKDRDCDTNPDTPKPDTCRVPIGGAFTIRVSLDRIAGLIDVNGDTQAGWEGIQARVVDTGGLMLNPRAGSGEVVNCAGGITAEFGGDGDYTGACQIGIGQFGRVDTGVMFEYDYTCLTQSVNTLTMPTGGLADSYITNESGAAIPDGTELDVLSIYCAFVWDVNGDGFVAVGDIGRVVHFFGQTAPPVEIEFDVTGDGIVSIGDIGEVVSHFGEQPTGKLDPSPDLYLAVNNLPCDTRLSTPDSATCSLPEGSSFTVGGYLENVVALPDSDEDGTRGYRGTRWAFTVSGPLAIQERPAVDTNGDTVLDNLVPEIVWPACQVRSESSGLSTAFTAACIIDAFTGESVYEGELVEIDVNCTGQGVGTVSIFNGEPPYSYILNEQYQAVPDPASPSETLTINCL